jgi:hypothetical protein
VESLNPAGTKTGNWQLKTSNQKKAPAMMNTAGAKNLASR